MLWLRTNDFVFVYRRSARCMTSTAAERRLSFSPPYYASLTTAAAPINTLPSELLIAIFTYAPHLARLRALALVCKRWRIAVLRSIRSFVWQLFGQGHHDSCKDRSLAAVLALLPGLTSLEIKDDACDAVLPVGLRCLKIKPLPTEFHSISFLSAHLPSLTALHLGSFRGCTDSTVMAVVDFASAHSSQLLELSLASVPQTLARQQWPALRRLVLPHMMHSDSLEVFDHAPCLQELSVEQTLDVHHSIPDRCLPVLKSIGLLSNILSPCLTRLRSATKLDSMALMMAPSRVVAAEHADFLGRTVKTLTLSSTSEELKLFSALRSLHVMQLPSHVPAVLSQLACLRQVTIGSLVPLPAVGALTFASSILRQVPQLEVLNVYMEVDEEDAVNRLLPILHDLVSLASSTNVHTIGLRATYVSATRIAKAHIATHLLTTPTAFKYGWRELRDES